MQKIQLGETKVEMVIKFMGKYYIYYGPLVGI
jgi:hypothetical protein